MNELNGNPNKTPKVVPFSLAVDASSGNYANSAISLARKPYSSFERPFCGTLNGHDMPVLTRGGESWR